MKPIKVFSYLLRGIKVSIWRMTYFGSFHSYDCAIASEANLNDMRKLEDAKSHQYTNLVRSYCV